LQEDVDAELRGIVPIYVAGGKEEVRPIDKILAGKIRTFMAAPTQHVILGQMATGRLQEAVTELWRELPFTTGMQLQHCGWNDFFVARFERRFPWVWPSDRAKWDGGYFPELHELEEAFTNAFLDPLAVEYNRVVVANDQCGPFLLGNTHGGWRYTGLPSGGPKTIYSNGVGNLILFYYCVAYNRFVKSGLSDPERFVIGENPSAYLQHTEIVVHGDDCVHASTDNWLQYCKPSALNYALSAHNYINFYDNESDDRFHISNATYLSQVSRRVKTSFGYEVWVPRLVSPEKTVAGIVYNTPRKVPKGDTLVHFRMSRFWQSLHVLWPDRALWEGMMGVGYAYEQFLRKTYPGCDLEISRARSCRKTYFELEWLYCGRPQA
jgi:hypothetical protein